MENAIPQERRHGLKKRTVFIFGLMLGLLIWRWRYVINGPLWVYRAARADQTDLYKGKTNGMLNRDLVTTARSYILQFTQIQSSGKPIANDSLQGSGVRLDPTWFNRHHPETVDYNPFASPAEGNFRVTWTFAPGCQRTVSAVSSTVGSNWFDLRGRACNDGYTVSVFMSPDLKPTAIKLTPMAVPIL